jgi:hypothetical protein
MTLSTFTKLTSTPLIVTTYTDKSAISGSTYCYAVTALSAAGESGFNALAVQFNKESSK